MKKIFTLAYCLLPFYAEAAVYPDGYVPNYNPGSGNAVGSDGGLTGLSTTDGNLAIQSGNGIVISSSDGASQGLNVAGALYIGDPNFQGGSNGDLYALGGAGGIDNTFTISSEGAITVADSVVVNSGYNLSFLAPESAVDMSFGSVNANGELKIQNADTLTIAGATVATTGLSVTAQSMNAGAINVSGALNSLNITSDLALGGFINSGSGNVDITTGNITSDGTIQNGQDGGTFNIAASGNLNITSGNLENSGSSMIVSAGDISVAGTVKNDSNSGSLKINADSLTVAGGDSLNSSFVNSGDLYLTVSGETNLAGGFDLSGMNENNVFNVTTGTLVTGNTDWINSNIDNFYLNVTAGALNAGTINNGSAGNVDAGMTLLAQSVSATSVINNGGNLSITANDASGTGIVVSGNVSSGNINSVTNLNSSNVLSVSGDVSNLGQMTLSGTNVSLTDVTNSGSALNVLATTGQDGAVNITGNFVNETGNSLISARSVVIDGTLTNSAGVTSIEGSDVNLGDLTIGAVDVTGGTLNLKSLGGGVTIVNGNLDVTDTGNMNIDSATKSVTVANGSVNIDGNVSLSAEQAVSAGSVNVAAAGTPGFILTATNGSINIGGDIVAVDSTSRTATFSANLIDVSGSVSVENAGNIIFGGSSSQKLNVAGNVSTSNGGSVKFVTDDTDVGALQELSGGKIIATGSQITATSGSINIEDGVWFDASNPTIGLVVSETNELNLTTEVDGIYLAGGMNIASGNTLNVNSAENAELFGLVNNSGTLAVSAVNGSIEFDNTVTNSGTLTANAKTIAFSGVNNSGGNISLNSSDITLGSLTNTGNFVQGGTSGTFNLIASDINFSANNLDVTGAFSAISGNATYDVSNNVSFSGNVDVSEGASIAMVAGNAISAADLTNAGTASFTAENGISFGTINNTGSLSLDSGNGFINVNDFDAGSNGTIALAGQGLKSAADFVTNSALYQNYKGSLPEGGINITSKDFSISANSFDIGGGIFADNISFNAANYETGMNVTVDGDVSGGVAFNGLNQMTINGNYTFNKNSSILANIFGSSEKNYWATVNTTEGEDFGKITNNLGDGTAEALITVNGDFISGFNSASEFGNPAVNAPMQNGQIGLVLNDIVDQGSAIWLLHTEGEGNSIIESNDLAKLRNLNVSFCNADGSICINYLDTLNPNNGATDEDLPAYVTVRDSDGDGIMDSLYVVFDPQFGGPIQVFKLQPIVAATEGFTKGEYASANAIDNLIADRLLSAGFYNRTMIELLPEIFTGSNLEQMAWELYNRMEDYSEAMDKNGYELTQFTRLFQPRELEQIAGAIALNDHTNYRYFEDRMFDEFIWNRNRNLKKAWLDVDFGMFSQNVSDGKRVYGNRFNVSGGFDWQASETMILGLTGRISNMSSDNFDDIDLSYADNVISGRVDVNVADTNIGLGGYLMKNLSEKMRVYGNAFLDIHLFDVSRTQNYVAPIEGFGTAFSLTSEWGLMHDWLNQYIVGNAYVRAGYNTGFSVKETANNQDYMNLESDGYLMFTPGYSLIAQKRIYPSAWFQIRPYASIGVEYDVLGAPDEVQYKFAQANSYTSYDVDLNPLWANIGGGVEMLSASGLQVGLDYRYQYNSVIQLHNIKVSGSYRF